MTAAAKPTASAFNAALALFILGAALTTGTPANAQVAATFHGHWKASWQTDNRSYEATMFVTETGGTWQAAVRYRNNVCAGREVPMKLESSNPTEARFVLQFSEVIPGCPNATVALEAAPDGSVTGVRSGKYALSLVRQ